LNQRQLRRNRRTFYILKARIKPEFIHDSISVFDLHGIYCLKYALRRVGDSSGNESVAPAQLVPLRQRLDLTSNYVPTKSRSLALVKGQAEETKAITQAEREGLVSDPLEGGEASLLYVRWMGVVSEEWRATR
jgi:hypothetical protein